MMAGVGEAPICATLMPRGITGPMRHWSRTPRKKWGWERSLAEDLAARYGALQPWPEAPAVLNALSEVAPLGIVTNCSEKLGRIAVSLTGAEFAAIVTAEAAGFYKPHPRPYQMALDLLNVALRTLPVCRRIGLRSVWHGQSGPPDFLA